MRSRPASASVICVPTVDDLEDRRHQEAEEHRVGEEPAERHRPGEDLARAHEHRRRRRRFRMRAVEDRLMIDVAVSVFEHVVEQTSDSAAKTPASRSSAW